MERMVLSIGKHNIRDGTPKSSTCCPVALALKECGSIDISVGPDRAHMRYSPKGKLQHYLLPAATTEFIQDFDAGLPVEPRVVYLHPVTKEKYDSIHQY